MRKEVTFQAAEGQTRGINDEIDKLLLRKRSMMETILDQLRNISQIEHTRHRSPVNFLVNLIAGLIAYSHQPKKPSLAISRNALAAIAIA